MFSHYRTCRIFILIGIRALLLRYLFYKNQVERCLIICNYSYVFVICVTLQSAIPYVDIPYRESILGLILCQYVSESWPP